LCTHSCQEERIAQRRAKVISMEAKHREHQELFERQQEAALKAAQQRHRRDAKERVGKSRAQQAWEQSVHQVVREAEATVQNNVFTCPW
jgi:hypothetical protein